MKKAAGEHGSIMLVNQNPTLGMYNIPFGELANRFDFNDNEIRDWIIWETSRKNRPQVLKIKSRWKQKVSGSWLKDDLGEFNASRFFVPVAESMDALKTVEIEEQELSTDEIEAKEEVIFELEKENQLADFLDRQWTSIKPFAKLEKIQKEYPACGWRIDFLARDKETDQFVIVELKKKRSSREVIGQLLAYMGCISREKTNGDHSKVRGIIVCQEQDEDLKLAASELQGRVTVFEYQVTFTLKPAPD